MVLKSPNIKAFQKPKGQPPPQRRLLSFKRRKIMPERLDTGKPKRIIPTFEDIQVDRVFITQIKGKPEQLIRILNIDFDSGKVKSLQTDKGGLNPRTIRTNLYSFMFGRIGRAVTTEVLPFDNPTQFHSADIRNVVMETDFSVEQTESKRSRAVVITPKDKPEAKIIGIVSGEESGLVKLVRRDNGEVVLGYVEPDALEKGFDSQFTYNSLKDARREVKAHKKEASPLPTEPIVVERLQQLKDQEALLMPVPIPDHKGRPVKPLTRVMLSVRNPVTEAIDKITAFYIGVIRQQKKARFLVDGDTEFDIPLKELKRRPGRTVVVIPQA